VEEDYYTVQEAARILRTTERTVRRRLEREDLDGTRDPTTGRWRVKAHSVTAAMEDRPPKEPESALEVSESVREYRDRVESLQRELGRLEGRLELTEMAESTLREQLERELERERQRADRAEEELRDARRSWWSRMFGR
jgi:excisionase family DNA binding protein